MIVCALGLLGVLREEEEQFSASYSFWILVVTATSGERSDELV